MIATVVDETFFASKSSGMGIKEGTQIISILPRMLDGDQIALAEAVAETAKTTNVTLLIVVAIMAVSLKQMWNFLNIVQVLAYIRLFVAWPAFMMLVLQFLDDAVTLKPVTDPFFEIGQSQFDKANSTLSDQGMKDAGIQDPDIVKSLGMFALVIFVLILLVTFWAITRCLQNRGINVGQKIKVALEKKLFYNSLYRYMIISNLKLTYTLWGFLLAAFSFATTQASLQTIGYLVGISLLLVWPFFIFVFLQKNQDRLDEPKMI